MKETAPDRARRVWAIRDCGHEHQEFEPLTRATGVPARWRVTHAVRCDGLDLEAGRVLELVLSDHTFQGCAGCEDHFVWSRYRVTDGEHAGRCVEFQMVDPPGPWVAHPMIPDWLEPLTE